MNRVRAGYPGQLDDLAILRREPADTVCFLDKRSNRSLHHSSNLSSMLLSELPPLLTSQTGCRGANRTLIASAKGSRPAIERPGITLSARLLSYTEHTTRLIHRRYGQGSGDPSAHDPPGRCDLHRARNRVPMQARSQSLRVQSFAYSYLW